MSSSDFRPIILYEFKLNESAVEIARKINQALGNESFMNAPFINTNTVCEISFRRF